MGKADPYFEKDQPFKEEIGILREVVLATDLEENVKWGAPIYTIDNKNVLGIMAFKSHYGLWFFNGVFLSDPENVLENAQEGKTKAMRHWKFSADDKIDKKLVLEYVEEAIENQRKGLSVKPEKKKAVAVPELLQGTLERSDMLKEKFSALSPSKQREYSEYIASAKQEKTKMTRLEKILPMIEQGLGLNDKYRRS